MAKGKARKQREKWHREGHLNPEIKRGTWSGVNPMTKRTPTLIEKQRKIESKHKKRFTHSNYALDKPFLFMCSLSSILHKRGQCRFDLPILFFLHNYKICVLGT